MMANKTVFIYLEGPFDRVSSLIQMAKRYHYYCFTHESSYKKYCDNVDVKCQIVPRGIRFKAIIQKLNPTVIILRGDYYYGEQFWLATHYKTIVVEECFTFRVIEDVQNEFKMLYKHSSLLKKIALPFLKKLSIVPIHPKLQSSTPYHINRSLIKAIFDRFYYGMRHRHFFHGNNTTKFCLSHEQNKFCIVFFGIDEAKIEVTGLPIFDAIPKLINEWNERGKIIKYDLLYISQPIEQNFNFNYYEMLFPFVNLLGKSYSICLKLHPREKIDDFKSFDNYFNINIVPHTSTFSLEDNIKLILDSKYIIGTGSSLIDLAILLDKPVIIYNFVFQNLQSKYEMLGLKFCVTSFEGVQQAIHDCENKTRRFYEQMEMQKKIKSTVILDGKSCERINEVIERLKKA